VNKIIHLFKKQTINFLEFLFDLTNGTWRRMEDYSYLQSFWPYWLA